MKIATLLEHVGILWESFSPSKVYLHGGPKDLDGGHFKRHARGGHDMGALFFIEESRDGYKYALGYAISRRSKTGSGVHRVKINIPKNKVFDFNNPQHKQLAKDNLSPEEYKSWENSKGHSGHIDWTQIDAEMLEEWGFLGAILHERSSGFNGSTGHLISIAVFDPSHIQHIDFIPKEKLIDKF